MTHLTEYKKEHTSFNYLKMPPIGIDLGTTNSAICYYEYSKRKRGAFHYYHNSTGLPHNTKLFPSMVYLDTSENRLLAGVAAYHKRITESENVAIAVKRKIDERRNIISLGEKRYSPIEITKEIIKGIFIDPIYTGLEHPAGIVVTVPYYFKQTQNQNTRQAVEKAIEEVFHYIPKPKRPKLLELLAEPIAAALYHVYERANYTTFEQTVLVFDIGGGTLDITIFRIANTSSSLEFEVLSSAGNATLGGEDFDDLLMAYIMEEANIELSSISKKKQQYYQSKIRTAIVEAKEQLSHDKSTTVIIGSLPNDGIIDIELKRTDFEMLLNGKNHINRNIIHEIETLLQKVLYKANLKAKAIDKIILIGGSAKIPMFQELLTHKFPHANMDIPDDDSLFLGVAKGAALYAAYLLDQRGKQKYYPFQKSLESIRLVTRTSHSLGVKDYRGRFSVIIPSNTKVSKAKKIKKYTPSFLKTQCIELPPIEVYQGESKHTKDNTYIGSIQLPKIYHHERKREEIEVIVTFLATVTNVQVMINIPQGNKNKTDINITKDIALSN